MAATKSREGTALLAVLVFVLLLGSLGASLLQVQLDVAEGRKTTATDQRAFYAAEAGISEAWVALSMGLLDPPEGRSANLGSAVAPRAIGTADYWVIVTRLDARRFAIESTARDGQSLTSHEVILSYAPDGFFQYAAFGGDGVLLDSNAFVDSYDSLYGSYASQVPSDQDWARENGVVGSNENIQLRSNTNVYGDVRPGPERTVDDSAPRVLVTGSTEPAEELVDFPPLEAPDGLSEGDRLIEADVTVGPGLVKLDSLEVAGGATISVLGPCDLVVDSFRMKSGATLVFEPADGPIKVYAENDFVLESNSDVVTNSDSAVDVQLFLSGDNGPFAGRNRDEVKLSANSDFVGAIYAPNALVSLGSNFSIFGSVMARELDLSSNGTIHFDEALLYDGRDGMRTFVTLAWRRRPSGPPNVELVEEPYPVDEPYPAPEPDPKPAPEPIASASPERGNRRSPMQ